LRAELQAEESEIAELQVRPRPVRRFPSLAHARVLRSFRRLPPAGPARREYSSTPSSTRRLARFERTRVLPPLHRIRWSTAPLRGRSLSRTARSAQAAITSWEAESACHGSPSAVAAPKGAPARTKGVDETVGATERTGLDFLARTADLPATPAQAEPASSVRAATDAAVIFAPGAAAGIADLSASHSSRNVEVAAQPGARHGSAREQSLRRELSELTPSSLLARAEFEGRHLHALPYNTT
jgi:hypothetical protein